MNRSSTIVAVLWLGCAAAVQAEQDATDPRQVPPEAIRAEDAGDWDRALQVYQEVLAAEPGRQDLWLRVADVEARLGHATAAAAATERAALLAPRRAAVHYRLAQARSVAGDKHGALAAAERAVDLEPASVEYLRARAQLAAWAGRYDLARDSYRRILRLRPDDPAAVLGLARVEAWSGELDEAVALYRRYAERYPDDAAAGLEHARAEAWRGNYPVAAALLEGHRERRGATETYREDKARVLLGAGRPSAALELLASRLESEPESPDLNADHALALAASGRPERALESLDYLDSLAAGAPRTEEARRVVGTPMRATVVPMADFYRDSDGVERSQVGLDGGVSLSPRSRLDAGIYSGEMVADAGSGLEPLAGPARLGYSGLWLGLERRLGPRVRLMGRVGEVEVDGGADLLIYRLGASFAPTDAFDLELELERSLYLVSPRALGLGIDTTRERLALSWRPGLRYHLEATTARDALSDGNDRWELVLAPRRAFLRREHFNLDLGLRAWWFGFDRDLDSGYYDPGDYRSYSVTGFGYWKLSDDTGLSLTLALGGFEDDTMDGFDLGGNVNLELTVGVYRDWMLKIRAGGTENARVGSGAFNAWGGGISLTRRFSGPGHRPRPSYPPAAAGHDAAPGTEPMDYASHLHAHALAARSTRVARGSTSAEAGSAPRPSSLAAAAAPASARSPAELRAREAPAPSAMAAIEELAAPNAGRIFELQLGLFYHEQNARALIEDLSRRGYAPYVVEVTSSRGETRYTVRLGPYRSMEEAAERAAWILDEEDVFAVIRYRTPSGRL